MVAVALLLVIRVPMLRVSVLQRLELSTLDYRFHLRPPDHSVADSSDIVIVEIDEDSFESLPEKYPWPRSYYAHLLRNLKAAGARAVGIDLIFSGGDAYATANDDSLRRAIRETGLLVLAGKRDEDNPDYIRTSDREGFSNIFYPADSCLGLVNIRADADGVYRLYNPYFIVDRPGGRESRIPTFAYAVLNRYWDLPPGTVASEDQDVFRYAGRSIPKYDPGSQLINFYGPSGTFRRVKFQDVIDDETFTTADETETGQQINTFSDPEYGYLHDGTFRNKIVLVGVTVPEYKDLFPVSVGRGYQHGDNLMYGVEIHANLIENILRNDFLHRQSPASEAVEILLLVWATFFVTSLLRSSKTAYHLLVEINGVLFAAAEIFIIVYASILLFTRAHYVAAVVNPVSAVLAGYVASAVYHFVSERKQRMLIKAMFSTYVNPSVVDELIAHPEKLVLGGERKELTVLFSDIEGFTTISEKQAPEQLVGILNEYLSVMSDIIFRNDGTLDKYEGDAIMAFWGAPIPQDDHALRACMSALAMQESLAAINQKWREEGKPDFRIRIGVNTGEMIVGNMGAAGKFAYTVIGDSVNIASRLEGANKEYRTGIIVSERTYELVRNRIVGRELDLISVRGRSEPVRIFELVHFPDGGGDRAETEFLARYSEAMTMYRQRRWEEAAREFAETVRLRPADYASRIHLTRARKFSSSPPPEDWNGVYAVERK